MAANRRKVICILRQKLLCHFSSSASNPSLSLDVIIDSNPPLSLVVIDSNPLLSLDVIIDSKTDLEGFSQKLHCHFYSSSLSLLVAIGSIEDIEGFQNYFDKKGFWDSLMAPRDSKGSLGIAKVLWAPKV